MYILFACLQIRMDLKHLKTKRQKAQQKHKNESEQLAVSINCWIYCVTRPHAFKHLKRCPQTSNNGKPYPLFGIACGQVGPATSEERLSHNKHT